MAWGKGSSPWPRRNGTRNDITLTLAHDVLAAILIRHGTQNAFGWFRVMGFEPSLASSQDTMSIPAPLPVLVMFTELSAALGLLLGLLSSVAAYGLLAS